MGYRGDEVDEVGPLLLWPVPTNPREAVKIPYLPQKADPNREGHWLIFSRAPSFVFCTISRRPRVDRTRLLESGCLALWAWVLQKFPVIAVK